MNEQQLTVPPEFAKLGVRTEFKWPDDPRSLRIVAFGKPKSGKTSFAASIPGNLILDFERKAELSSAGRLGVSAYKPVLYYSRAFMMPSTVKLFTDREEPLPTFDDINRLLVSSAGKSDNPFRMITVDSIDELVANCLIPFLSQKFKCEDIREWMQGKGYAKLAEEALDILDSWCALGYGVTVLGHLKSDILGRGEDRDVAWVHAITNSLFQPLMKWCQLVTWTTLNEESIPNSQPPRTGPVCRMKLRQHPKESRSMSLGANLDLPTEIVLPKDAGWTAFSTAYTKSKDSIK